MESKAFVMAASMVMGQPTERNIPKEVVGARGDMAAVADPRRVLA